MRHRCHDRKALYGQRVEVYQTPDAVDPVPARIDPVAAGLVPREILDLSPGELGLSVSENAQNAIIPASMHWTDFEAASERMLAKYGRRGGRSPAATRHGLHRRSGRRSG